MDLQRYLTGRPIKLMEMLDAREARSFTQTRILKAYPMTLICFTLNIAGPVKVFPLARWAFDEGICRIQALCAAWGFPIRYREETLENTGLECFWSVEADGPRVKQALTVLEEEEPLGRLFDLDVLTEAGEKVSREDLGLPQRRCLICGQPVFRCSRNRAHGLAAIQEATCRMMEEAYQKKRQKLLAQTAVLALLREVQTTPKPGLVDMAGSGAHRDMDLNTFQCSALALQPYFEEFAAYGPDFSPEELLPGLREIGIRAERAMREATNGVNTHKGMIFSMGILLCALSRWNGWEGKPTRRELREMCIKIAAPLAGDFPQLAGHSHGGELYRRYGIRGARGEALAGFPALFETALPALDDQAGKGWNEAGVITLLHIMASTEDSNAIARSSPERAAALRQEIGRVLAENRTDLMAYAGQLDRQLTEENISPGGSADILALGWFVKGLEEIGEIV